MATTREMDVLAVVCVVVFCCPCTADMSGRELYIAYIERMRSEMQPREDGARASRRAFCRVPRLGDCRPRG